MKFPLSLLGLCIVIFWSACQSQLEDQEAFPPLSVAQLTEIDSICQVFINRGNTIGLSVGIAHEDEVIFSKGYGWANKERQQAATDKTIYPIASISKFITAIATLKLVEEEKLSLSDKVVDHIAGFPEQAFMNEITIEHLLRHQSGLVDHEDWFDSIYIHERRVFSDEELYAFLDQPLFFRPGTQYSYSNSGYAILSSILEQLEQRSFHELIQDKFTYPYALNSLGLWPLMWDQTDAALGYELTEKGVDTSFHMMTKGMKGDGGLSASVVDLLKLMSKLTDGTLISPSALEQMLSPTQIGNIKVDYGLGVKSGMYGDQMTFGHSGGYKGTGWAILAHYPASGFTFAAAINTNYSPEEAWTLRHLIMPIVFGLSKPEYEEYENTKLERYAGEYQAYNRWGNGSPSTRLATIIDDQLVWDNPATTTPGTQLYPINDSIFSWKPYPFDHFRFHEVDGQIVGCSEYYDGLFAMYRHKLDD